MTSPLLRPFWLALMFLTRLPVPAQPAPEPEEVGRSAAAFPLAGAAVGLVLLLVAVIAGDAGPELTAALVVTAWVAVTGALHLDGLADTADAWVGGQGDPERTLAIMKDTHAGPVGVAAVVLLLLVKYAALASGAVPWPALLVVPVLARAGLVALFLTTPYCRPGGLGEAMSAHLPPAAGWWAVGLCALAAALLLGWSGIGAVLVLAGLGYLYRLALVRRIGGTTGDTAGAGVELAEAVLLVWLAW